MRRLTHVLLGTILICGILRPARAELIHGTLMLQAQSVSPIPGVWDCGTAADFSSQTTVFWASSDADICTSTTASQGTTWQFLGSNGARILRVSEALEDVKEAPTVTNVISDLYAGATYVVYTGDSLYVKFAVQGFDSQLGQATLEYYVQMDGTTDLDSTVPVDASSWGRIKSLYR